MIQYRSCDPTKRNLWLITPSCTQDYEICVEKDGCSWYITERITSHQKMLFDLLKEWWCSSSKHKVKVKNKCSTSWKLTIFLLSPHINKSAKSTVTVTVFYIVKYMFFLWSILNLNIITHFWSTWINKLRVIINQSRSPKIFTEWVSGRTESLSPMDWAVVIIILFLGLRAVRIWIQN